MEPTGGWGLGDVLPVLGAPAAGPTDAPSDSAVPLGAAAGVAGEEDTGALVPATDGGGEGQWGEGQWGEGQWGEGGAFVPSDAHAVVPVEGAGDWSGAAGEYPDTSAWPAEGGYGGGELVMAGEGEGAPEYVQLYDEASGA